MPKKTTPSRPNDLSLTSAFCEVDIRHAVVSTYKGSITIQLPGGDHHWFNLRDATTFHEKLGHVIAHRAKMDAWHLKYEPDGYEATKLRRARPRRGR